MQSPALTSTAEESLDALRVRVAALNRLLDVTQRLAAEVDTQRVLELIASEACLALVCERATVYQFDPRSQELFTRVSTDLEIGEIRHGLDQGISGYVARHREIVNVPDPPSDSRWNSRIDQLTGYQTRSILAAPLISPHDGALLGVLQVLNNVGGPFDPFDEELILAFASHAAVALDRARLVDELKERQHVEASLKVARAVQRGFMPQQLPAVPGYELASWWLPHQAVGADYCDVLPLDDGRTALVIADVAGHGIGPSLIMASTRAALRALALDHSAPEVQLRLLARALLGDLEEGLFITMLIAALDSQRHRIEYANAGHGPAMHYSAADDRFYPLESTGLPLGVEDYPDYPQATPVMIEPGDLLVLCTDGIVESMDNGGEAFGQQRLEAIIRRRARAPLDELVREVGRQVEQHYEGATPPDDLTILVVRRSE
ncbi:MAG TPA: GAF domain-containing SpoIIE family protein phosphatase [Pirellulales bacterium]|jgi:serine phosphatase RsbU (regulator of sigma subunit)